MFKLKPDITIAQATTADAEDIAHIHYKAWQESYHGIIDQEYLDALRYDDLFARRQRILNSPQAGSIHLVAKCPKSVGFCDAGVSRTPEYKGEIYAIYMLDAYKRSGIGKMLMQKASEHLVQRSLFPFIAWVLVENTPACHFYEKLGGIPVQQKTEKIGNRVYVEKAYAFHHLG